MVSHLVDGKQGGDDGADSDEEALSDYVVVERSDVLEAIGQFVAAYLATMPEAQHLQPKQLQKALTQTFKVRHAHTISERSTNQYW